MAIPKMPMMNATLRIVPSYIALLISDPAVLEIPVSYTNLTLPTKRIVSVSMIPDI